MYKIWNIWNKNYLLVVRIIHTKCLAQFIIHKRWSLNGTYYYYYYYYYYNYLCKVSPQNESPHPLLLWDLYTGTAPRASVRKMQTPAPWISLNLPEKVNELPWKKNRFLRFILISHLLLGRWKDLESWVWSISLYFWFERNNELKGTVSLSTIYIRHVNIYIISPFNHNQKRKRKVVST